MDNQHDNALSSRPKNKADLMGRIEGEWSALMKSVEKMSDEQLNTPGPGGWSVKDNLAHLAAWERFMLLHHVMDRSAHEVVGLDKAAMERLDEDGLNAILHERHRDRPAQEALAEVRRIHEQVLAVLKQVPFAELMEPRYPDDREQRPVLDWVIGNTYDHYREHHRTIESFAGR
jgi:uncharacterized protein (TIGR03083 family)